MRKYLIVGLLTGWLCAGCHNPDVGNDDVLTYVDPTIGGVGLILEPTRPLVHLPNSMLRVHPLKKDELDDRISGFPLTVVSHRIGWAFSFLPVFTADNPWQSNIVIHRQEAHPYSYEVVDATSYNSVAVAPNEKSGVFRITNADQSRTHRLRFSIINATGFVESPNDHAFSGEEDYNGMKVYFYGTVDGTVTKVETEGADSRKNLMATVESANGVLELRYGISFISVDQAKTNLEQEIGDRDFAATKAGAMDVWTKALSKIKVKGSDKDKRVFYTALYRTLERMVDINEHGRYYSAFDYQVHESDEPFYMDNWVWDSYIAHHPLNMILDPEKDQTMIRSYVEMYRQNGWMPSFAVVFGDWPAMVGNHASAWMADAWAKGLRDFDVATAYEGLRKNSLEATLIPWRNGPPSELDDFFNEHGYMPGLAPGEPETVDRVDPNWEKRQAVSVTLENSFSDWCIAQLAEPAGHVDEKELFLDRSQFYRNVFREDKGMVWPKNAAGEWIEPYNPSLSGREYFTEVNAYTYNWHVKHDLNGLFALMGGKQAAEAKLDQLFREDLGLSKWKFWATQPDASGLVGQFVMGNEPSLHIPYLYNYLGAPWKTQKRIRMLLDTWFTDNVFGMPGDEDGGAMSAWVVFSMMGFLQVTPGVPTYSIGSPSFEEVSIQLPNGNEFKVVANNNSTENVYIQEAKLNGQPLDELFFTHEQLLEGGVLELEMGDKPRK
ncbi:MAG TPA: GH92 family glycosyl hydrolase [Parapedobacter sp.]|uniref:GH92 family glycosyl hydrolase n=1 Tax=Parapedobacter sp. TaxID=1958893 RepID=UPI002C856BB3|nr:GH92 family glycosyl hydrolase [Parapedobacter sp.]HWK57155.1 GH92 family glycosyl hydrolase [Parapedobacter sp.]